jgi:hypothetical protein
MGLPPANHDQICKAPKELDIQVTTFHLVHNFKEHHDPYPTSARTNRLARSPGFGESGCSQLHLRLAGSLRVHILNTEPDDMSENNAAKGWRERLRCLQLLSDQLATAESQVQPLRFRVRRC